jgi:Uncharacterised nucleotidyltransferase
VPALGSMKARKALRKGQLVAEVLAGSWRRQPLPPLQISAAELEEVTPLLYDSGTVALGWRRISRTPLRETESGEVLHQAYRLLSLQSEIHEQNIEKVFRLLRQHQVEAILAKGWAVAGLYPERALRPYGDIDICVRPERFALVQELLRAPEAEDCWVDLHQNFSEISERTTNALLARAKTLTLGAEQVRVLSLEDQLALSCIHLLKHGAWRPLWLCDIGVVLESLPETFDWRVCLGTNETRAHWIRSAIALAKFLLRIDTSALPASAQVTVPTWLSENVLKQWARPFAVNQPPMSHPIPMVDLLRHPLALPEGLRQRWPNPIIATISVNGKFNELPRLPYQMANCLTRIGRLLLSSHGELQED